ncbi:MAG: PEP-CTERM sorting domain-containing protein, partial [Kiritimatiellae bacterium]|nr:PEP-CTERM sorting domain-containing protein [Kiritimatiellia bacterium]
NKKLQLFSVILVLASLALSARADYGFEPTSGSFAVLNVNEGGNAWYYLAPSGGVNPQFENRDFDNDNGGSAYNPATDSLVFNGFEITTWQTDANVVFNGRLYYRVYKEGSAPGGYSHFETYAFSDLGGGKRQRQVTAGNIDLLALASSGNGTYHLDVYVEGWVDWDGGTTQDDTFWQNAAGATLKDISEQSPYIFSSEFSITDGGGSAVPEPTTALIFAVGLIGVGYCRRVRRFLCA